jgi:hypothetical protein
MYVWFSPCMPGACLVPALCEAVRWGGGAPAHVEVCVCFGLLPPPSPECTCCCFALLPPLPQCRILVLTSTQETARICSGLFRGVSHVITVRASVLCARGAREGCCWPTEVLLAQCWVCISSVSGRLLLLLLLSFCAQMGSMIGTEGILLRSVEMAREWGWVKVRWCQCSAGCVRTGLGCIDEPSGGAVHVLGATLS